MMQVGYTLLVHGGAGTLRPEAMAGREDAFRDGLRRALRAGGAVLAGGGGALDAVVAAVVELEEDELFNAGRGAVLTDAGRHEMDAAVMDGADRRVGAVAGVCGPRNPVRAARAVMEGSEHVLLAGEGALTFCRRAGLEWAEEEWFGTETRREALRHVLRERKEGARVDDFDKHGTVGAVARDAAGRLAAATSTGGMTAKRPGRIGDSPVPGAGTWADGSCAVSCTGTGELFIRSAVAHEISARMRFLHEGVGAAADAVLGALPGEAGGLIAVGADGAWTMPFNTRGMYRGVLTAGREPAVAIYGEEPATG